MNSIRKELTLHPHQQRVVDEAVELEVKYLALNKFISSSQIYAGLEEQERQRLVAQSRAMGEYLKILQERISAF